MYVVTVPGKPKAMDRPRVAVHGLRRPGDKEQNAKWTSDALPRPVSVHVYVPRETLAYEELVASEAVGQGVRRLSGSVGVEIVLYVYAPGPRSRTGDVDNCAKSILDGLRGVAYEDDAQVDYLTVRRVRIENCADQRALVRVGRLEEFSLPVVATGGRD